MKIVVLAGGLSPERDVSLSSGSLIANALRRTGHKVLLLDVYEGIAGEIRDPDKLFKDHTGEPYTYSVPEVQPDLHGIKSKNQNCEALVGSNVVSLCKSADLVFIALHGAMGENGQIQAFFDVLGIKYTGTGYIGCLLAMDKDIAKRLMCQSGIPTAEWIIFKDSMSPQSIIDRIGLPCVVKPCSAGSSIGVSIATNMDQLIKAIDDAMNIEHRVIIEKLVRGREFSVGILNGDALPVIEIKPKTGFYNYKNKYQKGMTDENCPANLPKSDTVRVQNLAIMVHRTLQLGPYSRIDFIQNTEGEFICLEANTLPGMTPTSLLPQEALAAGITYEELCNRIIRSAVCTNTPFL
ncbi:MAG TPA: D-alanine--D-alanine ligase [Clostridiales bacterium]|nr:D-alanine--D-alanine ligase [Clostridiales bacterium]